MRIIIPAAGLGTRISAISKERPKALTPINGRPALHFIISEIKNIFKDPKIEIIIGHKGEQIIDFCKKYFEDTSINFIEQNELLGLAHAISLCEEKKEPLLVWLGDTIIQKAFSTSRKLSFIFNREVKTLENSLESCKSSFILSTIKDDTERWCCVKENKNKLDFFEKPDSSLGYKEAIIGIYFFKNGDKIIKNCKELIKDNTKKINGEFQLSTAMEMYQEKNKINLVNINEVDLFYYDIGSIDNYHITKKKLLDKRFFNSVYFQDHNSISKSSTEPSLSHQIRWFLDAPPKIKKYCPAIYEYDLINPQYEMEYFGFPTLQELFIWDDLHISVWKDIFSKLSSYLEDTRNSIFLNYDNESKIKKHQLDFYYFIINKTKKRIENSEHLINTFSEIVLHPCWDGKIKELFLSTSNNSFMHGDLCFSNILYDTNSGILKVIDPRGHWERENGELYVGGLGSDIYDMAKLMHSAVYDYDLIKNNIYKRNSKQEQISTMYDEIILGEYDDGNGLNDKIRLVSKCICFHLFVSMIPLHKDNTIHQKRMEEEALKIWSEICEHLI